MPDYRNHEPQLKARTNAEANFTTTSNPMADAFAAIQTALFGTKHFSFVGSVNNLNVQILGSIDGGSTYPFTAVSSFAVNAGTTVNQTVTTPYTHMKVQAAPAVGGVHGTLASWWMLAAPY